MRNAISMTALAGCLLASSALANDPPTFHNREYRQITGAAGQPARTADTFTHANGSYRCTNSTTRAFAHVVRFPFTLPDSHQVAFVNMYGRNTAGAPPMTTRLMKTCMSQDEVNPTTTELATATPSPNANGYFITSMSIFDTPQNLDCRYWAEARFDISAIPCTTGTSEVQKVFIEADIPDRIFRGMFNTNVDYDLP